MVEAVDAFAPMDARVKVLERQIRFYNWFVPAALIFSMVWGSIFNYARHKSVRIENVRSDGPGVMHLTSDRLSIRDDSSDFPRVELARSRMVFRDPDLVFQLAREGEGIALRVSTVDAGGKYGKRARLFLGFASDGTPKLQLEGDGGVVPLSSP